MSATNRVHIIEVWSGDVILTKCGKKGFKTDVQHEFDTAENNRFEAVPAGTGGENEPTCKRCLTPAKPRPVGTYAMPRYF